MKRICACCKYWSPYPLIRGMGACTHPRGRESSKPGYSSDPACILFEPREKPKETWRELYWCEDCGHMFTADELCIHVSHSVYLKVLVLPDEHERTVAAD